MANVDAQTLAGSEIGCPFHLQGVDNATSSQHIPCTQGSMCAMACTHASCQLPRIHQVLTSAHCCGVKLSCWPEPCAALTLSRILAATGALQLTAQQALPCRTAPSTFQKGSSVWMLLGRAWGSSTVGLGGWQMAAENCLLRMSEADSLLIPSHDRRGTACMCRMAGNTDTRLATCRTAHNSGSAPTCTPWLAARASF